MVRKSNQVPKWRGVARGQHRNGDALLFHSRMEHGASARQIDRRAADAAAVAAAPAAAPLREPQAALLPPNHNSSNYFLVTPRLLPLAVLL